MYRRIQSQERLGENSSQHLLSCYSKKDLGTVSRGRISLISRELCFSWLTNRWYSLSNTPSVTSKNCNVSARLEDNNLYRETNLVVTLSTVNREQTGSGKHQRLLASVEHAHQAFRNSAHCWTLFPSLSFAFRIILRHLTHPLPPLTPTQWQADN